MNVIIEFATFEEHLECKNYILRFFGPSTFVLLILWLEERYVEIIIDYSIDNLLLIAKLELDIYWLVICRRNIGRPRRT